MQVSNRRIVYYDLLNILACFCVVCLHSNAMVHTYVPGLNWIGGLAIEVVCYWAVPIFFMLSGANLMRYTDRYDTKTFFKKRFLKILIPYISWSVFFYVLRFHSSGEFGLTQFLNLFMTNGIEGVYWFFFPLLSAYFSIPILTLLSDNKKILWYLVGLSFVLQGLCPVLFKLIGIPWNSSLNLAVCGGYIIFVVLGYLLANTVLEKSVRYILYALGIGALLLRFFYTLFSTINSGTLDRTMFGYTTFLGILPAVAIFVFFKEFENKNSNSWIYGKAKLLATVSGCSFGVYLIHELFIVDIIFNMLGVSPTSILLRTVCPFLIYGISRLVILTIKKIPILEKIVP